MAPSGFFLGGMAEGMSDYEKRQLDRDRLSADVGIRTRGLDITERGQNADIGLRERAQTLAEKNAARTAGRESMSIADKHISDTMSVVSETVRGAVAAGRDPVAIQKAVAPLVESAKRLAARAGRDPSVFDAQVGAMLTGPTTVEAERAKAAGKAEGEIAGAAAGRRAAGVDQLGDYKGPKERADAENSLRDDYLKQAQPFITVRDFYSNMRQAEQSGAGDITRVFAFMKMQDPTSAVLPGEYASATNAAGVPETVRAMYNKLVGGGILSPESRTQIEGQAKKLFETRGLQQDRLTSNFAGIAKRQRLNVDNVITDLSAPEPPKKTGGKIDIPAPPPGFVVSP